MAKKSASTINPAEKIYNEALKFKKAYRYDEAIASLEQVKTKFPYSNYAKKARLKIADIHFEAKNFIQAQYSYQAYAELYPSDSKRDYVLFKIGHSLYKQLPKGHDRDLSSAAEAVRVFTGLLSEYPDSIYKKEALKFRSEIETKMEKKEIYIAKFYFKYKHPLAALKRFRSFIKNNPNSKLIPEAIAGAAYSAQRASEPEIFKTYQSELKTKFPKYDVPKLYTKGFVWNSL